jgi:hypothetical protein
MAALSRLLRAALERETAFGDGFFLLKNTHVPRPGADNLRCVIYQGNNT